ncbi:MAG: hypothetical protein HN345_10200 [Planctomycetaceae bacterium]|jgi:hypothetical protein|nr:hypothetical protein [Planctomycetaceae bacterium]
MIPKVGQLLRWYDNFTLLSDNPHHDVGIVKEVQLEGENFFGNDEYQYVVIVDWCKGPHHSYHDQEEWEESIQTNEIVVVE